MPGKQLLWSALQWGDFRRPSDDFSGRNLFCFLDFYLFSIIFVYGSRHRIFVYNNN